MRYAKMKALTAAMGVSLLVACESHTQLTPSGPTALARIPTSIAAGWPVAPHPDHRSTWISPEIDAKPKPLLFVSDAETDDVYMFALPSLKMMGTITGFQQPEGECSNSKGDVWITDANAQKIYQVSHSGRLEATLSDGDGYPVGCAWNAKNGDVAVMNIFNLTGSHGEVIVFPPRSKAPTIYENSKAYYYNLGGYDASGNLFFDGRNKDGHFMLSELPAGAKSAKTIKVSGAELYFPGMVQESATGRDLLVGDQECGDKSAACVYQLSVNGTTAKVLGTNTFENDEGGPVCDLVQGVEANGEIVGSDWEFCGFTATTADVWAYPGDGKPSSENGTVLSEPVGAALSTLSHKTWMKPKTSNDDLVYVSNADGEVTVYDYRTQALVGVLAAFENPLGECTDKSGDVYITDNGTEKIYEYAHGGTTAIKTLDDSGYQPSGCAIDRVTGNLAVANSGLNGNIALYAQASGQPRILTDSEIPSIVACGYDNKGTLLATGYQESNSDSFFAWLPDHAGALVNIKIPGPKTDWKWYGVSGIQWDGRYLVLDQGGNGVYQISLIHGQAYWVNQTQFDQRGVGNTEYGIYDPNPKVQGTEILTGYATTDDYSSGVDYFPYPQGGDPQKSFSHGVDNAYGIVISYAK
jgi:hypothetical protein